MTTLDTLLEEIRTGPSGPQIAAFFDFDGTLIDGYSAAALYSHRLRNFEIGPAEAAHTVLAGLRGSLSEDQFAELVERGIRGWAGRADDDLVELGERLFVQSIAATLFHDAWWLIKAHQRRGHTVVIATSATRFQAGPLAKRLGVENLLCTELEAEDGILTGRLAGRALWGPGKIAAVQAFATGHRIDLAASHGYANGDEDVPFLQAVGHPHPVNPQKRLAKVASARGWPVLKFRRRSRQLDPTPALRTAAMYGSLLAASGTGLTMGLLNRNRRQGVDVATSVFGDLAGAVGDIKIDVVGQQHLWSHRPAVFFINHQSALIDLVVTSRLLRDGFTFVAKKEIAQVPVIGPLFWMADVAFLDRADRAKAIAALQPALDRLRAGTSVVISPEGTRSATPAVGPFKKGGFHLAMQGDHLAETHAVERIALEVSHRINRATPVTPTAAVCVALLAADRALTMAEVLATVAPLADYLRRRGWPVAGAADLTDRSTVRRALQELVASGVLTCYSGGPDTVWGIGADQHLVAAVYRNSAIHVLVVRAIAELALVAVAQRQDGSARNAWDEALRLRDLLKFDFFFARRRDFAVDLQAELTLIDPGAGQVGAEVSPGDAQLWLERLRPHVAHLVLRPFLDAYWLVAEQLAAADASEELDEQQFLTGCLRVGRQWALQRRLASEESVSAEMFRTALQLARHRGLIASDNPALGKRRRAFADELREVRRYVGEIADIAGRETAR